MAAVANPSDAELPEGGALAGAVTPTLWRRLGGIAVDWLACIILVRLLLPWAPFGSDASALATLAIFYVEVTLLTWLTASSFGQRLVGIAVVSVRGTRLALWNVAIRTLMICLVIPALVYDAQGRGLQDIVAGSVAVMRRSVPGLGR